MSDELGIGLLSGTSRDGVDAVLVNFTHDAMDLLHARCRPYPAAIARTLQQLAESGKPPGADIADLLDEQLGRFFARVAQDLVRDAGLEMRDVAFIGSHGQTVWHAPAAQPPVSVQLGSGRWIAKNTGVVTVAGFRGADLGAGGTGAPLAPLLHQQLFHAGDEDRAVLNIGGIANLTLLPASGETRGFDTGPGNCLLDAWAMRQLQRPYDDGGNWAAKGAVNAGLLTRMLHDPYFALPPPKSTGPEYFSPRWLETMLSGDDVDAVDVQATLAEVTAQAVARGLPFGPARLLVCGGGARNAHLLSRLAVAMPGTAIETTATQGVDPDWVEGLLFAWLARERLAQRAQDTPPLTGAVRPVLLGDIFRP